MIPLDRALIRDVLDRALARGGAFAELFVDDELSDALAWDDGKVDQSAAGREHGAGLRVVDGESTRFANTNDLSPDSLRAIAEAVAGPPGRSREASAAALELAEYEPADPVEQWPDGVAPRDKAACLALADRAARDFDPRVIQATFTLHTTRRTVAVANSEGRLAVEQAPLISFSGHVVAADGRELRAARHAASAARGWEFLTAAEVLGVARTAARVACLQLGAAPAPCGAMPVVLSSAAGGTMIHEACGHGLEADYYLKRLSVYSGKLGQRVAGEKVTVVDDGTLPGNRGTTRIDDEGCPAQRVVLIDRGVLVGLLQSRSTAARLGMPATGNGRRESHRCLPIPRMRNTFICPGEDDPDEIVGSVDDGLFVAQMGGGEVDIVSGTFVFHCSEARRIRGGKLCEPVRDATLTGSGPEVLACIDRVGRDLGWAVGTCGKDGQGTPVSDGQPTIRIPSLVVGGAALEDAHPRDARAAR